MLAACKVSFSRAFRAFALLCLFLSPSAWAKATDIEPAYRDNFYDVVVRGSESWIVGYYGTILHSRDRGLTWIVQNSKTQEALFRVDFLDRNTGWVSGSYGTFLSTRDGGKHWQKQNTKTEEHLFGFHFLDAQLGWAVGSRGTILHTADGGSTWVSSSVGDDVIVNDVRFLNAKQGWVVGEFGRIYNTKDGGRTWTKQKSPIEVSFISGESRNLFRLLFPNTRAGWAFGLDGVILQTRNGDRWEVASPDGALPPNIKRHHIFSAAFFNGKKWAVGERGTVLISGADNQRWKPANLNVSPVSLNGIAFGADGLGFIVGNRGTVLRTENGGKDWKPMRIIAGASSRGVGQLQ